jgi:hypothetical protein
MRITEKVSMQVDAREEARVVGPFTRSLTPRVVRRELEAFGNWRRRFPGGGDSPLAATV